MIGRKLFGCLPKGNCQNFLKDAAFQTQEIFLKFKNSKRKYFCCFPVPLFLGVVYTFAATSEQINYWYSESR